MPDLRAQDPEEVKITFQSDSIELLPGQSFSNSLSIVNATKGDIKIDSLAPAEQYAGILFLPEYKGVVAPASSQSLLVRMIADKALLTSSFSTISYVLYYTQNNVSHKQTASFYLKRPEGNYVSIGTQSAETYFNPILEENLVHFFVQNPGYASKNITLKFEILPAAYLTVDQQQLTVYLAPGEKKYLNVRLRRKGRAASDPDYSLRIQAFEPGVSSSVSSASILIRSLSGQKNALYATDINLYKNFAEIAYRRSNIGNDFVKLRSNINTKIGTQKTLEFNTAADYFTQYNFLNVYDTRLIITTPANEYALGNLFSTGYDLNVSGRGARLLHKIGSRESIEILATQNSFSLFSSRNIFINPGYTIGSKYTLATKNGQPFNLAYAYTNNVFTNSTAHIVNTRAPVYSDSLQTLRVEGGVSSEKSAVVNTDHKGMALGVTYERTTDKLSFYSNNYYSSPYYAGVRRGLTNFYEMVRINIAENKSLILNYTGSFNNPKEVSDTNRLFTDFYESNRFFSHQVEAGFSINSKGYAITITPNYNYQKYPALRSDAYTAYRTRLQIAKLLSKQTISLSADYGLGKFATNDDYFQNARLGLNYKINSFYIDAIADLNPVNVYAATQSNTSNYRNYAISAGYNITPNEGRLSGNIYTGYNYTNVFQNTSIFLNANVDLKLTETWYLTATANYSNFESNVFNSKTSFENIQGSLGIKYSFDRAVSGTGNNVTLEIFEDADQNHVKDKNEITLPNVIVRLNNSIVAVTDRSGKLKIKNIPDGKYHIVALKNNQLLRLLNEDSIFIYKNSKLFVPTIKTYSLTGNLVEIKEQYNVQVPDVMGIIVYAKNMQTAKTYTTITDFDGAFAFQLPEGAYDIHIENNRYEIINNRQRALIDNKTGSNHLEFKFKNKEVKIDVKRF